MAQNPLQESGASVILWRQTVALPVEMTAEEGLHKGTLMPSAPA